MDNLWLLIGVGAVAFAIALGWQLGKWAWRALCVLAGLLVSFLVACLVFLTGMIVFHAVCGEIRPTRLNIKKRSG